MSSGANKHLLHSSTTSTTWKFLRSQDHPELCVCNIYIYIYIYTKLIYYNDPNKNVECPDLIIIKKLGLIKIRVMFHTQHLYNKSYMVS